MANEKPEYLTYKGKPLVREGNILYYGQPDDKYILMLQIKGTEAVNDLKVPTKVTMMLMSTDPNVPLQEKIIKRADKEGIYAALDVGMVWLDRALKK
jgi:hypothetical protein